MQEVRFGRKQVLCIEIRNIARKAEIFVMKKKRSLLWM